jgi:hypothetical protein
LERSRCLRRWFIRRVFSFVRCPGCISYVIVCCGIRVVVTLMKYIVRSVQSTAQTLQYTAILRERRKHVALLTSHNKVYQSCVQTIFENVTDVMIASLISMGIKSVTFDFFLWFQNLCFIILWQEDYLVYLTLLAYLYLLSEKENYLYFTVLKYKWDI